MGKSTHFFGQPIYGQLIKLLDKSKILQISRNHGGERYAKSFDGFTHLLTMLYAVIMRFDSLREIETSMTAEVRKLHHIGIERVPKRSTLSDANVRRSEKFFEEVYRDLYETNKSKLTSDSRRGGTEEWLKRLRIIDFTTISLFSNLILRQGGRRVVSRFMRSYTPMRVSHATYSSLRLPPMTPEGKMEYREQVVVFRKGETRHVARIVTYVDFKKGKQPRLISLLTNDFGMRPETIVYIYCRRWQIESLFKQIKQNFPLRYFYGESANAIKIQIWVTLIANLLLSLLQSSLERRWSFSGLATMVRIVLMYYLNMNTFFNKPDEDLRLMLMEVSESPPEDT